MEYGHKSGTCERDSTHRTTATCSAKFFNAGLGNTYLRSISIFTSDLLYGQEHMACLCDKLSEMFHCVRFDLQDISFQLTKRKNRPANLTKSNETLLNSMAFNGAVPAHLKGNRIGC